MANAMTLSDLNALPYAKALLLAALDAGFLGTLALSPAHLKAVEALIGAGALKSAGEDRVSLTQRGAAVALSLVPPAAPRQAAVSLTRQLFG